MKGYMVEQRQMYVWAAVYNAFFCVLRSSLVENSLLSEQHCMKVREKKEEAFLYYCSMNVQKPSKIIISLAGRIMTFTRGTGKRYIILGIYINMYIIEV